MVFSHGIGSSGSGDTDLALVARRNSRHHLFIKGDNDSNAMPKAEKTLSVFVDESGTFRYPDPSSRYYIVALAFFGGPRLFKRNILKYLKRKEI